MREVIHPINSHLGHYPDVDDAERLPRVCERQATHVDLPWARAPDRTRVLHMMRAQAHEGHRMCVGVMDPLNPRIATPAEVRDRVLEAAASLPPDRWGTTDDCGFAPFSDDTSRS